MKIFHKFNLIIILMVVLVVSAYSFYGIRAEKRGLMQEMIDQSTYFAKTVALGINSASFLERRDLLVEYLDQMVPESKGWIRYGIVTNLDNYAWVHTMNEKEYTTLDDEIGQSVLEGIKAESSFAQIYYNDELGEKILDVASLITVNRRDRGVLRLGFSFSKIEKKINDAIFRSIIICLVAIIIGIIVSTVMAKLVTDPVAKIVRKSREVSEGNLDLPIYTKSGITEIKELENSIEQMKRDLKYVYLGGMFADFHHAIKTDLGLITANIQYIGQNAGRVEKAEDIRIKAGQIIGRVDYINSEVNKYREYKKPQEIKMTTADINMIMTEVLDSASFDKDVTVEKNFSNGIPKIMADPSHLRKAIANIIRNATEAMPNGGHIKVKTEAESGGVAVRIADTGCGIPKENMEQIFRPDFSTKKKRGGEGIGLAIAKIIIEDVHHGKIKVDSTEGKGTVFSISLRGVEI